MQKQRTAWDCGVACLSEILYDISYEGIIEQIGHDGSEIWWPELPEPNCRRAFSMQEFVDVAYTHGYALLEIQAMPATAPIEQAEAKNLPIDWEARLKSYLNRGEGLILGRTAFDRWHMLYWNGFEAWDPYTGLQINLEESGFQILTFYLAVAFRG